MINNLEKILFFEDFRLDTREKLLRQGEKSVSLPPKVMDVLCVLVEKKGGVVSKDELMESVWADSFVEESNLTQSIYTLRRILGTGAEGKSLIETIPRRGFRISVPIYPATSSAKGVFQSLEAVSQSPETTSAGENKFWSHNKFLYAFSGLFFIAVLTTIFGFGFFNQPKNASAPIENVSFQKLTFSGDVSSPTISPDGKSIAFVKQDNLYLQDINNGTDIRLNVVDHNTFGNLMFSPNSEKLYFRNERRTDAGGDIFEVSRFGGAARKMLENSWSGIGFSPDGKKISFVRYFPAPAKWVLFIKNLETGEETELFTRNSPDSIYRTGFPAWSPDGRKIVTVAQEKPASTIYIIDAETGEAQKQNTPRFVQIEQTLWSAKGNAILLVGRENNRFFQLWRINYPSGELQRITNDLSIYRHISLSADGLHLIAENQLIYSHLWTASSENLGNQKQLTFGNLNRDGNVGIAWTPEGNIVYVSRITGDVDLWIWRANDGSVRQLTENSGQNNENPVISPDGKFIYFESTRSGSRHIWRIDIDGQNPTQITFAEKETEFYPALSPAGKYLYFLRKSSQGNAIVQQNLLDRKEENITEQGSLSPNTFIVPSPDGNFVAFHNIKNKTSDETAAKIAEIGVISLSEQNKITFFDLPKMGGTIYWTKDGKGIDYLENSSAGAKIWRKIFNASAEPELLLDLPKTFLYSFAWSQDRKNLALARGKQERDLILLKNFE